MWERVRESKREKDGIRKNNWIFKRERERVSMCVCVNRGIMKMQEQERERERESVCVCVCDQKNAEGDVEMWRNQSSP